MSSEAIWYYSTGGQEQEGPVAWEQVEAAHAAGVIGPGSFLWAPHLSGWVPALTLLGAPPAPPPLPVPPGAAGAPRPVTVRVEAPGAKAGRLCGIWALVTLFLCFPVAMVLGILALVKTAQAARLAKASPGTYLQPGSAGTVMGIIALAAFPVLLGVAGIAGAIAIPAFVGQRDRARDRSAMADLDWTLGDLVGQYDKLKAESRPPEAIKAGMDAFLQSRAGISRNPWNPGAPAFSLTVAVVEGLDQGQVAEAARARATEKGQGAFVVQFPGDQRPGFLGGAVLLKRPVQGAIQYTKAVELE